VPIVEAVDVQKLKSERDVKRLMDALSHEDWKVRSEAAWALGEIKDARAVEPLIKALEDEAPFVRKAAAQALGKLDDVRAVGPLIAGFREAIMRERTDDHPGWLHVRISEHFSYYTAPITIWRDVRLTFSAVIRKFGTYAVEPLCALFGDSDHEVRQEATRLLGQIKDTRTTEPLIAALTDEHFSVRWSAMKALDSLGWKPDKSEAGAAYWAATDDFEKCVEISAPAVKPLINALRLSDSRRRYAAEALGKIKDPRAVEPLIEMLGDKDECEAQREAAAWALGQIGVRAQLRCLLRC